MRRSVAETAQIASIGDDLVILDTREGKYFSCNSIGAQILTGLQAGELPDEITARISLQYAVPADIAKGDVDGFIGELIRSGLYV